MRGAVKYMRSIQEIDRELERARQKMERSRKLDVILQDLKEQVGRRRQAEEEARAVLEKERGDVEELERMSLVSFLARIQGDLESRKAEERREAGALLVARVNALKELIPFALEVKAFCPPLDSSSCDFVLYSEVPQASDLPLYQNHPEHQAVLPLIRQYLCDRRCCDIEG